MGEIIMTGDDT